jgi:hypothetical protein
MNECMNGTERTVFGIVSRNIGNRQHQGQRQRDVWCRGGDFFVLDEYALCHHCCARPGPPRGDATNEQNGDSFGRMHRDDNDNDDDDEFDDDDDDDGDTSTHHE